MKINSNTILLVDDDPDSLFTLAAYLEEEFEGYRLITANNGRSALDIIQQSAPELIITDWQMPEISGLELLRKIKAIHPTRYIPTLIISGIYLLPEDLKMALNLGASDYLRKPINKVELWARVQTALEIGSTMRGLIQHQAKIAQLALEKEEQKNREITTKAIEIHKKDRILIDITDQLNEVANAYTGVEKKKISSIARSIAGSVNDEQSWEGFRIHFEQVHPRFFELIQKRHPNMSQDDLKLCAFLKIQLSNQQIADLLHISQESARTQKYRLKKKMQLPKETSIQSYINETMIAGEISN